MNGLHHKNICICTLPYTCLFAQFIWRTIVDNIMPLMFVAFILLVEFSKSKESCVELS